MKISQDKEGLSMIELLIVAVIIGLLTGLLMKGVGAASESQAVLGMVRWK